MGTVLTMMPHSRRAGWMGRTCSARLQRTAAAVSRRLKIVPRGFRQGAGPLRPFSDSSGRDDFGGGLYCSARDLSPAVGKRG